jgi:hypothetical protein
MDTVAVPVVRRRFVENMGLEVEASMVCVELILRMGPVAWGCEGWMDGGLAHYESPVLAQVHFRASIMNGLMEVVREAALALSLSIFPTVDVSYLVWEYGCDRSHPVEKSSVVVVD